MCGFIVFIGPNGAVDVRFAEALETLHHRGPDATGMEYAAGAVFGFKRLSIIEVADGQQPARYGRWTVVFNGAIYNYRELRAELRNFSAAPIVSEAEVIAAAFEHWGPSALHRFRGMFALVAWDAETGTGYAARDPFGIKPLYFMGNADGVYLASEKKALLPFAGAEATRIDHDALSHYMSMQYVPEPATLTPAVRRLEAGHLLTVRAADPVPMTEAYFRPSFRPVAVGEREAVSVIRDALRDSVHRHLLAEVPVGAFLSSGVDSTAVVALAREVDPNIRAYTVGFSGSSYSEVDVAQHSADELGVRLTATYITPHDVIEALPKIVWHLDDPVADPALVPLYFLAERAARDVAVVVSGEGADELFGGYEIYREPSSLAAVAGLPTSVKRGLRKLSTVLPEGVKGRSFLDRATTPIEERYWGNARIFSPEQKADLLQGHVVPLTDVTGPVYERAAGLDPVSAMQYVDLSTWLPGDILTKADRMTMAHSLELRVPFLDRAVYAAAAGLPARLKLGVTTKYALREAVREIVPSSIVDRPKLGFPTPTRVWLRGLVGEWAGDVFAASTAGDLLDLAYVQRLLAAHRSGKVDNSRKVWTVLMFCLWHAQATAPAPAVATFTRPAATRPMADTRVMAAIR
jgi:asparagine synthase (glutamine-hydrolysing)